MRAGGFDSVTATLYSLAAIVIGLIVFASVSLIYNAFSISVSERTKQFGLLSSVGATKKQLRRMVTFEALAVSAIGIPLGIEFVLPGTVGGFTAREAALIDDEGDMIAVCNLPDTEKAAIEDVSYAVVNGHKCGRTTDYMKDGKGYPLNYCPSCGKRVKNE